MLIRVALFFLQHSYNVNLLQLGTLLSANKKKYIAKKRLDRKKVEVIVAKFRDIFDLV